MNNIALPLLLVCSSVFACTPEAGETQPFGDKADENHVHRNVCAEQGAGDPDRLDSHGDTWQEATLLPAQEDCDVGSLSVGDTFHQGIHRGETPADDHAYSDIDWFAYSGIDSICDADPSVNIFEDVTYANIVRVCMYPVCLDGAPTTFTCPEGSEEQYEPGLGAGCCSESDFRITDLDCGGTLSEDADIFMSAEWPDDRVLDHQGNVLPDATCQSYFFGYSY
tara:strand:+ start:10188 stop:10856 length:669 start_codon:yes stop_codon:yes gene_type:complete